MNKLYNKIEQKQNMIENNIKSMNISQNDLDDLKPVIAILRNIIEIEHLLNHVSNKI